MGYESRIYIAKRCEYFAYYEVIAEFDLCKMGYDMYNGKTFRNLFTLPLEGDMYMDDGNTLITEDCYGDAVEGAELTDVLDWLNEFNRHNDYWRAKVFADLLHTLNKYDTDLILYHYGY